MTKFVFIFYGTGAPDISYDALNAAVGDWFRKLGGKVVDGGNPFKATARSVTTKGVSEIGQSAASGYTVIECNTLEEAVELAKLCPLVKHFANGAVQVYEATSM